MMFKTNKGWTILEWIKPEDWHDSSSGIITLSEKAKRDVMRKQEKKIFVAGNYLPDVIRVGLYVDGGLGVKPGTRILFNKHDGVEFVHEGKTFYTLRDDMAIAVV